mgnify:CR=1 FL=1
MSLSRFYSPLAAIAAIVCCASCSDDIERTDLSATDAITFSVSDSQEWLETGSRSELPSVTDPVIIPLGNNDGEPLYVHVALQKSAATFGDEPKSRGELLTGDNFATKVTEIGLIGYKYTGTTFSFDGATPVAEMNNIKLVENGNHWEAADKLLRWPGGDDKYAFVAYAPYHEGSADDVTNNLTLTFDNGTPLFTYKCGSAVENNPDFVVAYTDGISTKGSAPVELNFIHPLASMKFKASDDFVACKISKLDITGATADSSPFLAEGTYRLSGAAGAIGAWDAPAADAARIDMGLTIASGSEIDAKAGNDIGSATQVFMAIPEETVETTSESAPKAKVDIALNISGVSVTASPELPLFRIPGYTTIYTISNKNSVTITTGTFEVKGNNVFEYTGGTNDITVTSTAKINDSDTEVPVGWTTAFDTEDGTCPDWLTMSEPDAEGNVKIAVAPQDKSTDEAPHATILRNTPEVTDYDLSKEGDASKPINTANCYIVNAPGTYRLPLVYGNAIKNGNTNLDSGIGETNFIPSAKSAEGVVDPWIPEVAEAIILWQDVQTGMISNAAITSDNKYMTFSVDKNTIQQGNAVVAVRDASQNILWSWHIWVTDFKPGDDNLIPVKQPNVTTTYNAMPYTLGYCAGPNPEYYPARDVTITFTQDGTGEQKEFVIRQQYYEKAINNNTPFYQWGRKDPFPAATNVKVEADRSGIYIQRSGDGYVKNCIYAEGVNFTTVNEIGSIEKSIAFPYNFYLSDRHWYGGNNDLIESLWGNVDDVKLPKKTIYDPSPVGYCIPPKNFAWTKTDAINRDLSTADAKGYWVYCNENKKDGLMLFLPSSGRRHGKNGTIEDVSKYCMLWTSKPAPSGGYRFWIDPENAETNGFRGATGCAVLAIKEQ